MEDWQPKQARKLDDARIAEKLGEIALHGWGSRGVGRAEVEQQDGGRHGGLRAEESNLAVMSTIGMTRS